MTPPQSGKITDIDLLTRILAIRKQVTRGEPPNAALVRNLADTHPQVVQETILALNRLAPMAILPERWVDDRPVEAVSNADIPEWISRTSVGWGDDGDFSSQCADAFCALEDDAAKDRFLTQMAVYPGAQRRFSSQLRSRGLAAAAKGFARKVTALRRAQFPLQIGVSPTMACQMHCDYCIAAGNSQNQEIDQQNLDGLLDWAERSGVKRIGLAGGEPSLFSDFAGFVARMRGRGFEWYMATNGMASPEATQALIDGRPLAVTMHLTEETLENPSLLAHYCDNARRQIEAGINTVMRINFSRPDDDPLRCLELAAELGMHEVRAAIPMPNSSRQNEFIDTSKLTAFGAVLQKYVALGRQKRLKTVLSKPFPLCKLPLDAAHTFLANGSMSANCPVHAFGYSNNMIVAPDMSYIPCLGLDWKSKDSILEQKSPRQATLPLVEKVRELTRQPFLETCKSCPLWHGGRCIGGCLSYRLEGESR
ncbi:MAG: hypothetical protein C0624_10765 [Desulfuromonas sp.]|nr:MAG: hypothetical protein C0624_10765 [Desulfuromonas sp.]